MGGDVGIGGRCFFFFSGPGLWTLGVLGGARGEAVGGPLERWGLVNQGIYATTIYRTAQLEHNLHTHRTYSRLSGGLGEEEEGGSAVSIQRRNARAWMARLAGRLRRRGRGRGHWRGCGGLPFVPAERGDPPAHTKAASADGRLSSPRPPPARGKREPGESRWFSHRALGEI